MRSFVRRASVALPLLAILSCNSNPAIPERDQRGAANLVDRHVAQDQPPLARVRPAWVFSWTNRPSALTSPAEDIRSSLKYTQSCLEKFKHSTDTVEHCEGDGMAAGPGLYTCDNPFTSHDYGNTLIAFRVRADQGQVRLVTGAFAAPPASGGLDRELYEHVDDSGLIYDFRPTIFGGRALVIRNEDMIDVSSAYAMKVDPPVRHRFGAALNYACTSHPNLREVMANWGEQMEYMALSFAHLEGTDDAFWKNDRLTDAGLAAMVASDSVAMSDAEVTKKFTALRKKFREIQDDTDGQKLNCYIGSGNTTRACVADRIYRAILGTSGDREVTPWSLPVIRSVLVEYGTLDAATARQVRSLASLRQVLRRKTRPEAVVSARKAFDCVKLVANDLRENHFGTWGQDP